jgi:hypothetical protein
MTDVWQPLTTYSPGAQVIRSTVPPVEVPPPVNGSFDLGDSGWTKGAQWTIEVPGNGNTFDGTYAARMMGKTRVNSEKTYTRIYSAAAVPAAAGQVITASVMVNQGGASAGGAGAKVQLEWLDESLVSLKIDDGNEITKGSNGEWKRSTVTATAPASTAYVRLAASAFQNESGGKSVWIDQFKWDYSFRPAFTTLIYTAVQDGDGISAALEPDWPADPSTTVNDGTVIWGTQYGSSVEWEAFPLLESGLTEPEWPTEVGSSVVDGSIVWTAASRRVIDDRCPHSKVVAIAASKIFAGDDDIIAYSATVNPLDWSTIDDAGYLPFGLQTHGANPVAALGLYRGNLVGFNAAGFQMWQVDQDPANMALLDAAPIGSTEARCVKPLQNDLIFLNSVGVRNISIAGASTNLQAGSSGEPVDALVQPLLREREYEPFSAFWPALGQYWVVFGPEVFVLSLNEGKNGKWSRFLFPEALTDITLLNNDLYVRTAEHKIWRMSEDYLVDDYFEGEGVEFTGIVHWPHLDFGALGVEKQFIGFDLVAEAPEGVSVSIGYDQRDVAARTAEYDMDADSLPGRLVPIPVTAPSFDLRLTFAGNQAWEWMAAVLYVNDLRSGS